MTTSQKQNNVMELTKTICQVAAVVISVIALLVSKKNEKTLSTLTKVDGHAGIVQSGGQGSFSIGDMRVGTAGLQLPPKEHGSDRATTTFAKVGNEELKNRGMRLASDIRALGEKLDADRRQNSPFTSAFLNATNQIEKERLWAAMSEASQRSWAENRATYNRQFKIDAVILRDEMRSRLPKATYGNDNLYEEASGTRDLSAVADDLERLAKLIGP
jgi:hypothetical protein